jgi:hypothetical protein
MTPALRRQKRMQMKMMSLSMRISNHISPLLGSIAFISARMWYPPPVAKLRHLVQL